MSWVGRARVAVECRRGVEHSTVMEIDLGSRNAGLVVGEELSDSVEIPGYEHHSTWGYDLNTRSYWASLWPNKGDRDDPPMISVGWSGRALPRPDCVLVELCTQLRHDPLTVARGLGLMRLIHPRTPEQLATRHVDVFEPGVVDGYTLVGSWLVGDARQCPASGWPCHPGYVPGPEHIWAEVLYVTGRLYLGERTSLLTSLDEALCYAARLTGD